MYFECSHGSDARLRGTIAKFQPVRVGATMARNVTATNRNAGTSGKICPDNDSSGSVNPITRTEVVVTQPLKPACCKTDHMILIPATDMSVNISTTPARPPSANHGAERMANPIPWIGYQ